MMQFCIDSDDSSPHLTSSSLPSPHLCQCVVQQGYIARIHTIPFSAQVTICNMTHSRKNIYIITIEELYKEETLHYLLCHPIELRMRKAWICLACEYFDMFVCLRICIKSSCHSQIKYFYDVLKRLQTLILQTLMYSIK